MSLLLVMGWLLVSLPTLAQEHLSDEHRTPLYEPRKEQKRLGFMDELLKNAGGLGSVAGLDLADAGPALAALLPLIVDALTPKGRVPEESSFEGALGSLLSALG